ncbi:hypothetical protein Acr_08g0001270 [Actinidia rufa]|uniref:F-box protein n=1 Tax=Actinidia rufa TaxID=165716 RepID=A0A7J0EZ71_9ERIC|nr:hypothetical protein Acr_08g0001270 [Actinidia rufa]
MVIAKLYTIMEMIADRVEMHKNIGEQRNNWNSLLLTSINTITLTASHDDRNGSDERFNHLNWRKSNGNAARLFKQLHEEIRTTVSIGTPTLDDVKEAMDKVLALDKAYPLPLLGVMLEKFPKTVEPARWWPEKEQKQAHKGFGGRKNNNNGWDSKLEEELKAINMVLKRKDAEDYLRLGGKALKLNKALAISGPLLTGLAAVGSALVGTTSCGSFAVRARNCCRCFVKCCEHIRAWRASWDGV